MMLTKNGLYYSGNVFPIFPDAYIMRSSGSLVYAENGIQCEAGQKLVLPKQIRGYAESNRELFTIYDDQIVSESGNRFPVNVKQNLRIYQDGAHQIRVMNGSGVHFFGMFNTTYMLTGIVLSFQRRESACEPYYSAHTVDKLGNYQSYEITETSCKPWWDSKAIMTKLTENVFMVCVELSTPIYYIVDFQTGFAIQTREPALGLHQNGQNVIIEYLTKPYFELVPLGSDNRIPVPEPDFIKNTKSARNL